MDFLGNYFNDVSTPEKYYTKEVFHSLLSKLKVNILERISRIKLYPSFLLFMSNPDFNFVYLINKDRCLFVFDSHFCIHHQNTCLV